MAFKSIGQKYGFVSAGDVFRQEIADAASQGRSGKTQYGQENGERQGHFYRKCYSLLWVFQGANLSEVEKIFYLAFRKKEVFYA